MDTKTELLETALRLFSARGYDNVGVQEVVQAAGVTKPTLYHHFGSKLGLLEALLDKHLEPQLALLHSAPSHPGDLPMTLFELACRLLDAASAEPSFHSLLQALRYAAPESEAQRAVAPRIERRHALLEARFAEALKQHPNLHGRQRSLASTFIATLDAYLALHAPTEQDRDGLARLAVKHFLYGIYAL